jgi:hypothetical protein
VYELFTSRRSFCALEKTVGKMAPSSDGCFIVLSGYKVWEETGRLLVVSHVDEMVLNDPS